MDYISSKIADKAIEWMGIENKEAWKKLNYEEIDEICNNVEARCVNMAKEYISIPDTFGKIVNIEA